jgi:hypothetical protein
VEPCHERFHLLEIRLRVGRPLRLKNTDARSSHVVSSSLLRRGLLTFSRRLSIVHSQGPRQVFVLSRRPEGSRAALLKTDLPKDIDELPGVSPSRGRKKLLYAAWWMRQLAAEAPRIVSPGPSLYGQWMRRVLHVRSTFGEATKDRKAT